MAAPYQLQLHTFDGDAADAELLLVTLLLLLLCLLLGCKRTCCICAAAAPKAAAPPQRPAGHKNAVLSNRFDI